MAKKYQDENQPKEMYRIAEVANILRTTKHNVYRLIEKGKLDFIRFGRKGDGGNGELRIFLPREVIRMYRGIFSVADIDGNPDWGDADWTEDSKDKDE